MLNNTIFIFSALILIMTGCGEPQQVAMELAAFPADNLEGLASTKHILLDADSRDGGGSLSITVEEPTTIRLYETGDIDVEDAMLIYEAAVRSRNLDGMAYLEMWCVFDDGREFFSRGLNSPWTGDIPWSVVQTPFFLKKGQNPVNIRLNLVIDGSGSVWIDDIHLLRAPLPSPRAA
ncbi:MAG: hypothetical protein RRA94_07310 [Bacteroidota bacterium]|nr:hypothetical protein [Bacteroidota bacterium]